MSGNLTDVFAPDLDVPTAGRGRVMSTRLTRSEKRALVAIGVGTIAFFVAPWVLAAVAFSLGFEAGVVEP